MREDNSKCYMGALTKNRWTSVMIGTDCIGSCKSNYQKITATTAPTWIYNIVLVIFRSDYGCTGLESIRKPRMNLLLSPSCDESV